MIQPVTFQEVVHLLGEIDRRLEHETTIIIVGGAYAMLSGAPILSEDIDLIADPEFWRACEQLRSEGHRLPLSQATLAQPAALSPSLGFGYSS